MVLLEPYDRKMMSLVNKKLLNVYQNLKVSRAFHLQGHTDKLFRKGLEVLLSPRAMAYEELWISKFDLRGSFDGQFSDLDNILGKPVISHLKEAPSCKSIQTIRFTDLIITKSAFEALYKLFPMARKLFFKRCVFLFPNLSETKKKPRSKRALKVLSISIPMIGNDAPWFRWLQEHYGAIHKLEFEKSGLSRNRATMRRFERHLKPDENEAETSTGKKAKPSKKPGRPYKVMNLSEVTKAIRKKPRLVKDYEPTKLNELLSVRNRNRPRQAQVQVE